MFKNEVLLRKSLINGFLVDQLVLPEVYHEVAFKGLHDEAGHQSRDRTVSLIKLRFFWPQLDQFVEHRVRSCLRCIHRKTLDNNSAKLVSVHLTCPVELVCMDFPWQ